MEGLFGRKVIYSPATEIHVGNVVEELNKALEVHNLNTSQIEYLYNYYRGQQPVLQRVKTVRPEINNKIVSNHAYEIVSFKTGYVFGEPVQYVKRGEDSSEAINRLNDFMLFEDKASQDKILGDWFHICGTAYRMVLPGGEAFEMDVLDPRYTFVVYNSGFKKRPLMGVTYSENDRQEKIYTVYTANELFEIVDAAKIRKQEPHILRNIPIIEYPANKARLGAFEIVLPLLNALNNAASNRLDGVEQHIQSFLKFINCDIDEDKFLALKNLGALTVKGEPGLPADVDLVTAELSQSETQVLVENIYNSLLIICGMPNRHGATKSTSDTGQAVMYRDGHVDAESRARDTELMVKQSERQFLKLVLRILEIEKKLQIDLADIDIKFTRNRAENLLTKSQGLQNLLEAGTHPRIALATCGLFSDPEQVWLESEEYMGKWLDKEPGYTPGNNKPDPKEAGGEM